MLDELFDRLPRSHVRVGDAITPTYLVLGLAGIAAGTIAMMLSALAAGLSLLLALSLVPIGAATLLITTLLRRWITGVERLVLLEQFAFVLVAVAATLHVMGAPVRPYLDPYCAGLAVFLVFGRIGCFLGGCCYGLPARFGVCYPPECGHAARTRRFPLQLVEAALWIVLSIVAIILAISRGDGSATAATLAGYAVGRLALEPLRGDPRGRFLGATEGQWLSVAAIGTSIALVDGRPTTDVIVLAGIAIAIVVALILTARWWLAQDRGFGRVERASIRALAPELRNAPLDGNVQSWQAASLVFAASALDETQMLVSVSSPARPLVRAEATLALSTLCDALDVPFHQRPIESGRGIFAVELARSGALKDRRSGSVDTRQL